MKILSKLSILCMLGASQVALKAQSHPDSLYFDLSVVLKPNLTSAQQANVNTIRQQLSARTVQTLPRFGAERWVCQVKKGATLRFMLNNQVVEMAGLTSARAAEIQAVGIINRSGTSVGVSDNPVEEVTVQQSSTVSNPNTIPNYLRSQDTLAAGSTPVKLAILDSGLDLIQINGKWVPRHESLRELFQNGEVVGYDFTQNTPTAVPQDLNGHGTFVTGIVHAILKKNGGLKRLPNGKPVVQVHIYKILDATAKGSEWSLMAAISKAIDDGIDIVNCSFTVAQPTVRLSSEMASPMKVAMNLLATNKILMSVASGNSAQNIDNQLYEPTMYKQANMIVTGSINENLTGLSTFTNYGSTQVDIFSRGEGITSTYLNGTYRRWKGSSFSAPQTTAFAALLLTNACATGDRTVINRKVRKALVASADLLNAPAWLRRSCTSQGFLSPSWAKIIFRRNNTCVSERLSKQLNEPSTNNTLLVFPNPFDTGIMLDLNVEKETEAVVQVVNLMGTVVWEEKRMLYAGQNAFSIIMEVPKGMYLLQIKGDALDVTQKLLKQ